MLKRARRTAAAATVFAYPGGFQYPVHAAAVVAMVVVPALLMVSTIRFRSFKTFDLQSRQGYPVLILVALGMAMLLAQPEIGLVVLAYGYLASAFAGMVVTRIRRRPPQDEAHDENAAARNTKAL